MNSTGTRWRVRREGVTKVGGKGVSAIFSRQVEIICGEERTQHIRPKHFTPGASGDEDAHAEIHPPVKENFFITLFEFATRLTFHANLPCWQRKL